MTSTVLDVTVMLLCVSASVVALGGLGGEPHDGGGPAAEDVADRLATETATVVYRPSDPVAADPNERTVHATFAELLGIAAATGETTDGARIDTPGHNEANDDEVNDDEANEGVPPHERFRSRTLNAVSDAVGPRTRLDVLVESTDSAPHRPSAHDDSSIGTATLVVGSEPPMGADVTAAVATAPAPATSSVDRVRIVVRVW